MAARWQDRCKRRLGRGAPLPAALALSLMSGGPALAAPPPPDVTIMVVDNPNQLNERVNTLSLPPAAQANGSKAAGTKPAGQDKRAPAKHAASAARESTRTEQHEQAAPSAQAGRSARSTQPHATSGKDQGSKRSRSEASQIKGQSAQPEIDDGPARGPVDVDPDLDNSQPQGAPPTAQPDTDDQPPKGPPGPGGAD